MWLTPHAQATAVQPLRGTVYLWQELLEINYFGITTKPKPHHIKPQML